MQHARRHIKCIKYKNGNFKFINLISSSIFGNPLWEFFQFLYIHNNEWNDSKRVHIKWYLNNKWCWDNFFFRNIKIQNREDDQYERNNQQKMSRKRLTDHIYARVHQRQSDYYPVDRQLSQLELGRIVERDLREKNPSNLLLR